MSVAIVVGNPKPRSRTYAAAQLVATRLTHQEPDSAIDLTELGAALLDWTEPSVTALVDELRVVDLVVFASPTYKASYTGLLKLFLDRIPAGALAGVIAIPLMLGGDWRHSLAPELLLKPVLCELGATCPTRGLFLVDHEYATAPALDTWLEQARPQLASVTASLA